MTDERTALYRLFGEGEQLLYIGIAQDPLKRWVGHSKAARWWPQVISMRIEWQPNRERAEQAEVAAIEAERPRYNRRHAHYRGVGLEEARKNLASLLNRVSQGETVPLTYRGSSAQGFFVPPEWYRKAREALGDPTDL